MSMTPGLPTTLYPQFCQHCLTPGNPHRKRHPISLDNRTPHCTRDTNQHSHIQPLPTTTRPVQTILLTSGCFSFCHWGHPHPKRWERKTPHSGVSFTNLEWSWLELWHLWPRTPSSVQRTNQLLPPSPQLATPNHGLYRPQEPWVL